MAERRRILVYGDWEGLGGARPIGELTATVVRGREVHAFSYDPQWLARPDAQAIDPELSLFAGPHYPRAERAHFGVFLDSSPDRWGQVLMRRREALHARRQGRPPRPLRASDYLLGVHDGHRLGAMRFKTAPDGPFLDDDDELASPPWTSLRELEHASQQLERDGVEDDPSYGRWLGMLLAPGRSLGGARPKASVLDPEGALWMAKLPSTNDTHDIGAWEYATLQLARAAGLDMPEGRCERFGSRHHTFMTRRFDRRGDHRIHFASAMTMLERQDGDPDISYLDLVEAIVQRSSSPKRDLEQLWRRIAFSVCVSNVDDHLRNHGFLLTDRGWRLSPAYDLNPVPWGDGLTLNIDETDNAQDLELVRAVAPWFRLEPSRAAEVLAEVVGAVRGWDDVAARVGISTAERASMARAFRVADANQ